jgi:adenylylsulfate kinase-like enzyme
VIFKDGACYARIKNCFREKIPTGIDSPYEEPARAELTIDTSRTGVEEVVEEIVEYLSLRSYIKSKRNVTSLSFD